MGMMIGATEPLGRRLLFRTADTSAQTFLASAKARARP